MKLLKPIKKPEFIPMGVFHHIYLYVYWAACIWPKGANYEKTLEILDTPLKVAAWLRANVEYEQDLEDDWKSAEETFITKRGDCEDWAIFANACLRKTKYKGNYLCMYSKKSGHATYLIKVKDYVYISVGTFGCHKHYGEIRNFLKDWKGYKNWKSFFLKDEKMNTLEMEKRK